MEFPLVRSAARHNAREKARLRQDQQANQGNQRQAMKEDVAQDFSLVTLLARSNAGDNDALSVNHLAHHTA